MKQKTYRLTERGDSVLLWGQVVLFVVASYAFLHIFARAVVWLGNFLNIV